MLRKGERANANLYEAYVAGLYLSHLESMGAGEAFNRVSQYLQPLFTPIAEWALDQLKNELRRIEASQTADDESDQIDAKSRGANAMLNEHFTKYHGNIPTYDPQRCGEQAWTIVCTARGKGTEV